MSLRGSGSVVWGRVRSLHCGKRARRRVASQPFPLVRSLVEVNDVERGVAISDLAESAGADLEAHAAAALLTQLSPLVVRAVRLVVGSGSAVAEDAAQEALLEVSRSLPQLKNVAAAPAWAMRIASRVALRAARREARLSFAGRRVEGAPELLADTHPSNMLELKEAFDRLPPRVRVTAVLRLYVGLSEAETATALDCSVGTVKSQLHEARRRLSRDLAENPSRRGSDVAPAPLDPGCAQGGRR
jgi:RNA polymerase sigma factor (sigma-70 family)